MAGLIWNDWNISHIAKHGVTRRQTEYVVANARRPFPSYEGDGKWLVQGQDESGEYLQVIYVLASQARGIDYAAVDLVALPDDADPIFVIHARPLEDAEKRALRKRTGRRHRKGR